MFDRASGQSIVIRTTRSVNAPHFSTKDRILGAAETLFARHGFAGASLRQVTAAANVNLAAVNYHFGSKDNLIEEVFRRRLDELNVRRLDALKTALDKAEPDLDDVLGAFIRPALELSLDHSGGHAFMRVLARAYAEHDERLRRFLSTTTAMCCASSPRRSVDCCRTSARKSCTGASISSPAH